VFGECGCRRGSEIRQAALLARPTFTSPPPQNARTHPPGQIAQLKGSILEFGFNAPILVDSNDGIVAGHGRLLAIYSLPVKLT
jgi:ParB-like chromosome segregation protein Spo0J